MKTLKQILEWLFPVSALVFGILLALSTFDFPIANASLLGLVSKGAMSFITGTALAALGALYFIARTRHRAEDKRVSLSVEGAQATITIGAVQDFVRRTAGEFSSITDIDPQVAAKNNELKIVVNVSLKEPVRIPDLAQSVTERVRVGLQADLGIAKIESVELNVKKILTTPPPA